MVQWAKGCEWSPWLGGSAAPCWIGPGSHLNAVAWVLPKVTQTPILSDWNLRAAKPADLDGYFGIGLNAAPIIHLIWPGFV